MKRHLHCAEQQGSPSKIIKYCACHKKSGPQIWEKTIETSFTVRGRSENDPRPLEWSNMSPSVRNPPVRGGPQGTIWAHFVWKNILFYAPANKQKINHISPNIAPATKTDKPRSPNSHQVLRLPRKVTSQDYQINTLNVIYIALSNLWDAKCNGTTTLFDSPSTWNVIIAPSNRSHLPTSPNNVVPATKSGIPKYERKRLKRHFQCAADPRMIRAWARQSATRPFAEVPRILVHFVMENISFLCTG